jgi:hypothetical protein
MPSLWQTSIISGEGGVVRRPQGVDAHAPHDLHLPHDGVAVDRGAERPEVVMQVDPIELHVLAVQVQPLVGVDPEPADAEARAGPVDHPVADDDGGAQRVEVGVVGGPQVRVADTQIGGPV